MMNIFFSASAKHILLLAVFVFLGFTQAWGQYFAIVGTGTGSNTTSSYPAPFGNYYWGARNQMFVTAAQLTASGIPANSTISSLGFNVTNWNSASTHNGFNVKVFTTTSTNPISGGWVTAGQVANSNATNVGSGTGWRMITFATPFVWNGTDNLVIESCFQNSGYNVNASTQWTTSGLGTATWSRWYVADASGVCTNTSSTNTSTSTRPNIRFEYCPPASVAPTTITGNNVVCSGGSTTLTTAGGSLGFDAEDYWYEGGCPNEAFTQEWMNNPYTVSTTTVNAVGNGFIRVTSTNADPWINMYTLGSFNPNNFRYINIRYRVTSATGAGSMQFFWTNGLYSSANGAQVRTQNISSPQNVWQTISIDMANTALGPGDWYHSNVTGWRFDWCTTSGCTMEIDFVTLSDRPILAEGVSVNVSPTTTTTYFTHKKGACNTTSCASRTVFVQTGSIPPTSVSGPTLHCIGDPAITLTSNGGSLGTDADDIWYEGGCPNDAFTQEWTEQPYGTNQTTVNSVSGGILSVTSTGGDPMLFMDNLGSFDPAVYRYLNIRYRVTAGTANNVEIFFYNAAHNFAVGGETAYGTLISDGTWRVVSVDMWQDPDYLTGGNILGWRFDWCTASGVTMEFDFVTLSDRPILGVGPSIQVAPTAPTTYFTNKKGGCNTTSCASLFVDAVSCGAPTITNFTPTSACAQSGSSITINGTNLAGASVTVNGVAATVTSNSTTQIIVTLPAGAAGSGNIAVTTSGGNTSAGTFTVLPLPIITTQPQSLTVCEGANGSFSVATSSGSPTYQWQYFSAGSWLPTNPVSGLSGHNDPTLNLTGAPAGYNGASIRCVVTAGGCSITSNAVTLTVVTLPTGGNIAMVNYCQSTGSGTVTVTGVSNAIQYQWALPGGLTGSSTTASIAVSGSSPAVYTVSVTPENVVNSVNCPALSALTGTVNVVATPSAPGTVSASSVSCSSLTLNWGAATNASGYEIQVSTVSNFATFVGSYDGTTDVGNITNINITGLTAGTPYWIRVRARNSTIPCRGAWTNLNTTSVSTTTQPVAPVLITSATTICPGGTVSASLQTAGSGGFNCTAAYQVSTDGGTTFGPYTLGNAVAAGTQNVQFRATWGACGGSGCNAASNTYTVTVQPTITGTFNFTYPTTSGGSGTLTVTSATGGSGSYQYSIDGSTYQAGTGFTTGLPAGTSGNVWVRNVAAPQCPAIIGGYVIGNSPPCPIPAANAVVTPATAQCQGSTVTLTANGLAPGSGGRTGTASASNYGAISFNGTSTFLRNTTSTGLPSGSVVTVEAWINPAATQNDASYNGIVSYGDRSCNNALLFSIQNNLRLSMANWCNDFVPSSGPSLVPNVWSHVAMVLNGTSVTFYINGELAQSGTLSSTPTILVGSSRPFIIGCTDNTGRHFNGAIDNVRIWGNARTQAQIQTDMYRETPSVTTGLTALYLLNNSLAGSSPGTYTSTLTATAPTYTIPSYYTYSWSGANPVGSNPTPSTSEVQTSGALTSTSNFTVTAIANGCSGTASSAVVATITPTPTNNTCSNAIFLASASSTSGSLTCATLSNPPFTAYRDVWYSFTPTCTGTFTVTLSGLPDDKDLFIYTGSCGSFTSFASSTNSGSSNEVITQTFNAGTTYFIAVQDYAQTGGSFNIAISNPTAPAQPSAIAGTLNPEIGSTQTYSVTNVAGLSYTWSFPPTWTITSGQGTNSVQVTVGTQNGTISVTPTNNCGVNGIARTATTTIPQYRALFLSADIGGPASWCTGTSRTVTVTVKNNGTATWTNSGADINLGIRWNGWTDHFVRTDANDLLPGQTQTYSFVIEARNATAGPTYGTNLATGSNNLRFDLVYEGCFWFRNNTTSAACGSPTVSGNAEFVSSAITITTVPTSVSASVSPNPACEGNTITLTGIATGATSFSWTGPDGFTASTQNTSRSSLTTSHAGVYNFDATNVCGTTSASTASLVVNTIPTNNACSNAIVLTAGSSASGSITCASLSNPPFTSGADVWYTFTPTCTGSFTTTLSGYVNNKDLHIYSGSCGSFTVLGSATSTTAGVNENVTLTLNAGVTYYIAIRDVSLTGGTFNIAVSNPAAPAQPSVIAGTLNPEVGSTQTYSVTNVAGLSYTWSFPPTWTITSGQGTNSVQVTVGTQNGTISVTPTNNCGLNGTPQTATTTIPQYRALFLSADIGGPAFWCTGTSRTVTVTVKNNGITTWTDAAPDINIGIRWFNAWSDYHVRTDAGNLAPGQTQTYSFVIEAKNATAGPVYGANLAAGTYTLRFDVVNEGNCWFSANSGLCGPGNSVFISQNITITTPPTSVSVSISPNPACQGNTVNLTGSATGATSFGWTGPDGFTASTQNTSRGSVVPSHSGVYTFSATNVCGTTTANTAALVVNPTPANDACVNATPFTIGGGAVVGTLNCATFEAPFTDKRDVWYSFTPPCNGTNTVTLSGLPNDKDLYIYASCGTTTSLYSSTNGGTTNEVINVIATGGNTYYIRVYDYANTGGNFTLNVTQGATSNPAPSVITGPVDVCLGTPSVQYSVVDVPGNTYNWTLPVGWSITSGSGTNQITVTPGSNSGNISVTATSICGTSAASILPVFAQPLPIANAGPDLQIPCSGSVIPVATSNNTTLFTEDFGNGTPVELTNTTSAWRIFYRTGSHPANRTRWWIHNNTSSFPCLTGTSGSAIVMQDPVVSNVCDYAWDNGVMDEVVYNVNPIDGRLYTNINLSFYYVVTGERSGTTVRDYFQVVYSLDNGTTWISMNTGNNGPGYTFNNNNGVDNGFFSLSTTPASPNITPASGTHNVNISFLAGKQFLLGFRWYNDNNGLGNYSNFLVDNIFVTGFADYSWSPLAGVTSGNTSTPSITQPGTYTVIVTAGNGCSASDNVEITPTVIPAAPNVSNSAPICEGGTINLFASGLAPGGQYATFTGNGEELPGNLFTSTTNNHTIEFWVNPAKAVVLNQEANSGVSGNLPAPGDRNFAIAPLQFGGSGCTPATVGVGVCVGTNGISVYQHGPCHFPSTLVYPTSISGWTHVAIVHNNNVPYLYINGNLVKQGLSSLYPTFPNAGTGFAYGHFNGSIDNVRVWNTARTPSEIRADMFFETPSLSSGLIAHYPYNGNTTALVGPDNTMNGGVIFNNANYLNYAWTGAAAPLPSTNETQTTGMLTSGNLLYTVNVNLESCIGMPANTYAEIKSNNQPSSEWTAGSPNDKTDWFDPRNWSNCTPGDQTVVTIPRGHTNYPVVTETSTFDNATVKGKAKAQKVTLQTTGTGNMPTLNINSNTELRVNE